MGKTLSRPDWFAGGRADSGHGNRARTGSRDAQHPGRGVDGRRVHVSFRRSGVRVRDRRRATIPSRFCIVPEAVMFSRIVACVVLGTALFSSGLEAQSGRTVRDGVSRDGQATRGSAIYKEKCASCHGPTAGGSLAPPLTGDAFAATWGGPLSSIVDKIQATMPANAMGTLTRAQSADVLAFMLQTSKFPARRTEL